MTTEKRKAASDRRKQEWTPERKKAASDRLKKVWDRRRAGELPAPNANIGKANLSKQSVQDLRELAETLTSWFGFEIDNDRALKFALHAANIHMAGMKNPFTLKD